MPPRKRNEEQFGKMARRYAFYAHKWRDRTYIRCPNCHKTIMFCPYCKGSLLLQKAQTKPDFLMAMAYVYVEAKGATDRWPFSESIRDNQRIVAEEHETWLFLEIGTGRAPNGKEAYFVPWSIWAEIEAKLIEDKIHSLVFESTKRSKNPTAREILGDYALEWNSGGWAIPSQHYFWKIHGSAYLEFLSRNLDGTYTNSITTQNQPE